MTKTLRNIVWESALVMGVFAAGGGAVGYEIERGRKANYEREMAGMGYYDAKYTMKRGTVAGGAILGGAIGAAICLFGEKRKKEIEEDERKKKLAALRDVDEEVN
jgi:hypothetical protein